MLLQSVSCIDLSSELLTSSPDALLLSSDIDFLVLSVDVRSIDTRGEADRLFRELLRE